MRNSGFSLIELIIVIAIFAVLAVIALPSFKAYLTKNRIDEINTIIQEQLDTWVDRYSERQPAAPVLSNPDAYIASVTHVIGYKTGTVTVVFNTNPYIDVAFNTNTVTITYTAREINSVISWTCAITGATGTQTTGDLGTIIRNYFPLCS